MLTQKEKLKRFYETFDQFMSHSNSSWDKIYDHPNIPLTDMVVFQNHETIPDFWQIVELADIAGFKWDHFLTTLYFKYKDN